MCGIVGYVGNSNATDIILNGLRRLEYRGYDSAGLAVIQDGTIAIKRDVGKLNNLAALINREPLFGNVGIGHTRWATHGEPSARNAHPHIGMSGEFVVVHNGIVENFMELKSELSAEGVIFSSDTDTEVIVHLIERFYSADNDLLDSTRLTLQRLKGAHGVVVLSLKEPDTLVAARIGNAGGVVIGLGNGEMFVASDMPAILEHTREVVFLESHQLAVVKKDRLDISTIYGENVLYDTQTISWDPISAEKGEYRHFMHKEIHEQVRALTDSIAGRVDFENIKIRLPELNLSPKQAKSINKIYITACGTAYHAGLVGKILIERIAKIPVEVDIASEFRYRDPIVGAGTVLLAISQSGETADTLAAMEEAKKKGALIWSIVNAIGSQAMRIANGFVSMQTGPEIGVASTKAFTAPLVDLYMLAIYLADLRDVMKKEERESLISNLMQIPNLVGHCLDRENQVVEVSKALLEVNHCLYLGRGINMPIAYEGALKLKEISYIHAEGYPAGEMKHGPIALIDKEMPVIVIAPKDPWYDKMLSQIEQAKARGGPIIVVATDGDQFVEQIADHVLWIPESSWFLSPVITVIPLQLLAYHIAALRGLDVDQPRNLAKSVTVE